MRPWQHARSSAKSIRKWEDDLPLHEFIDATKFACAERGHRAVLHHVDLGTEVAARAFPERSDVPRIVRQHVVEDLGTPAALADWFDLCNAPELPTPIDRRVQGGAKGVANLVAPRLSNSAHGAVLDVCELLFLPNRYLPEHEQTALALFMNSVGPMLVRRIFGPPSAVGDTIVDHAWIAEAVIFTVFGRIPDLGEITRCWTAEPTADV